MTDRFRDKSDDSRWKFFCLTGIGVIAITYLPALTHTRAEGSSQSTPDPPTTLPRKSDPINHGEDLQSDRSSLPMTPQQIEQSRSTLIRRGFSPMHADTILPAGTQP